MRVFLLKMLIRIGEKFRIIFRAWSTNQYKEERTLMEVGKTETERFRSEGEEGRKPCGRDSVSPYIEFLLLNLYDRVHALQELLRRDIPDHAGGKDLLTIPAQEDDGRDAGDHELLSKGFRFG